MQNSTLKIESGITMIALIVTVIILLILSGVTLKLVIGENDLIKKSRIAVEKSEMSSEKELIQIAVTQAIEEKNNILNLKEYLDNNAGEDVAEVIKDSNALIVKFNKSGRYYEVDEVGNISDPKEMLNDKYAGDITKGGENDGSMEKPFEINCIEDLIEFSIMSNGGSEELNIPKDNFSNKYIKLKRNLDFSSIFSYNDYKTRKFGDINKNGSIENIKEELTNKNEGCYGFPMIGNRTDYSGNFDGNSYEIKNVYIKSETQAAFFGSSPTYVCNNKIVIKNLIITGDIISTQKEAGGFIAHYINKGSLVIENCNNKCNVTGVAPSDYHGCGGIVGCVESGNVEVVNCVNEGNVTLEKFLGATNCVAAGGIVGECRGGGANLKIYNSYNAGNIESVSRSAGILGATWAEGQGETINCCNYGRITSGPKGKSNVMR